MIIVCVIQWSNYSLIQNIHIMFYITPWWEGKTKIISSKIREVLLFCDFRKRIRKLEFIPEMLTSEKSFHVRRLHYYTDWHSDCQGVKHNFRAINVILWCFDCVHVLKLIAVSLRTVSTRVKPNNLHVTNLQHHCHQDVFALLFF